MSAASYYTTLKAAIDALGYSELPDLLDIEEVKESHSDKGYVLQPTDSLLDQEFTGRALAINVGWKLDVVYKHNTSAQRVVNKDLFLTLIETLYALDNFIKYTSEAKFNRLPNLTKISVGSLTFLFGREVSE